MLKKITFTLLAFSLFFISTQAQKTFYMGMKGKMLAALHQADVAYYKDKKYHILCPKAATSGEVGEREMWVFDNRGEKLKSKKVLIVNDQNKPHHIEKLFFSNDKIVCYHSFYDKAEKKFSIFVTTIGDDGDPDGLGKEIISIETKSPEFFGGLDVVFSPDSSRMMCVAVCTRRELKKELLDIHCAVSIREDLSTEKYTLFTQDIPDKGYLKPRGAVTNNGLPFIVAESSGKTKAGALWQNLNVLYKDNEEVMQSKELPKNDMKFVTGFQCKFTRSDNFIIAGYYTRKVSLDFVSGNFLYVYDIATNDFILTNLTDFDEDAKVTLLENEKDKKVKDINRPAYTNLYFDNSGNVYMVSHQYENPEDLHDANTGHNRFITHFTPKIKFKNSLITVFDAAGDLKWQKAVISKVQFETFSFDKVFLFTLKDKDLRFSFIDTSTAFRTSKSGAPSDPDHAMDSRSIFACSDDRIVVIGHSPSGMGSFYLDMIDMAAVNTKAHTEVEKRKKKK